MKLNRKIFFVMIFLFLFILILINVFGAVINDNQNNDNQNCDKSKGYIWCDEKQKCIRPFEESCNDLNDSKEIFPVCLKYCLENRKQIHLNCINEHKNESKNCGENYKECLTEAKVDFKNKGINVSGYNSIRKECSKNYVTCLKEIDNKRKECIKNITQDLNCEKRCRLQLCNLIYNPVCGEDNKTYSNDCLLKNADVKKACNGECPCAKICPKYYRPVCGVDNKTYGNECELESAGINKACNGKCPCKPVSCALIYNPVCGEDNKTYSNECMLRAAGVKKACEGECPCKKECYSNNDCNEDDFCKFPDGSCLLKCDTTTNDISKCLVKGKCTKTQEICPALYKPVCGCDGKTYNNECVMNLAKVSKMKNGICNNVVYCSKNEDCKPNEFCKFKTCNDRTGKCTETPEICPLTLIYQPVCGCDGNTYSSECEMNHFKVSKKHSGACEIKECDKLRMNIIEELKIVQKCESDEDCIFGLLNTSCTIYMCGASYNKNADLTNFNTLSKDYIEKCQKFCPMYACADPKSEIVKCTNKICQTYYKPNTN